MPQQSKTEVRERFQALIQALRNRALAVAAAAKNDGQAQNLRMDKADWSGDLLDITGMSSAFSREEHSDDVQEAIKDAQTPGTVGDLQASVLQGEYLACVERAYRLLHSSRIRLTLHAAARLAGHGHENGLFQKGVQGTIEDILIKSKSLSNT